MARRAVTHSRKDQHGNITGLGNPAESWSVRAAVDAIRDINTGIHTYYVPWQSGATEIRVVQGAYGPYLRTDRDATSRNNLDDLDDI